MKNKAVSCTFCLAVVWGLSAFLIGTGFVAFFWLKNQEMPFTRSMLVAYPDSRTELSVVLPRLIDPFVMVVPVVLLVLVWKFKSGIYRVWTKGEGEKRDGFYFDFFKGIAFGGVGGFLLFSTGIKYVAGGAFVAALIVLLLGDVSLDDRNKPGWSLFTEVIAALAMWPLYTLLMGTIPGLLYTAVAFGVAFVTHFGVFYICRGLYEFAPRVKFVCSRKIGKFSLCSSESEI